MKVSDLDFSVELSSSNPIASRFPSDDVVGISIKRPDKKKPAFKMKIRIPEAACKKAKIQPLGFLMAKISTCSNGMQILFQEKQGDKFKGYATRANGAYVTEAATKERQKSEKNLYLSCYAELTVQFSSIDAQRTQAFMEKYVPIIHSGKEMLVVDISKIPLYVKK